MALTSRISFVGPPDETPEDFLSSAIGVIFPDDVTNQHGDPEHSLLYTSPYLPNPLCFDFAEPDKSEERRLFSHYLWNSSLLLAEVIEAGTLGLEVEYGPLGTGGTSNTPGDQPPDPFGVRHFDVTGLTTLEFGAGTGLPSLLAALLGASQVAVTDYPAPVVMETLRVNIERNSKPKNSPRNISAPIMVAGHSWGETADSFSVSNRHKFDRVLAADCLWMPWQHANLQTSISWFLRDSDTARAWVVAGFHTGRAKMRDFFSADNLATVGLEVDRIWERDCDGVQRDWVWDRGIEDITGRKRWLVIGILKRILTNATTPSLVVSNRRMEHEKGRVEVKRRG